MRYAFQKWSEHRRAWSGKEGGVLIGPASMSEVGVKIWAL